MPKEPVVTALSKLSTSSHGVFRAEGAIALGVTPNQLARLTRQGVIERVHPSTYRMTAVTQSSGQTLHAALLWAGDRAAAAGRSAAELYRLEGVRATRPEIVLPYRVRGRIGSMTVYHGEPNALMVRTVAGFRTTGVECTLLRLAHSLDEERFGTPRARRRGRLRTRPREVECPGRHGFHLILATWNKATKHPEQLLFELAATMGADRVGRSRE